MVYNKKKNISTEAINVENKLHIKGDQVFFEGFELIKTIVTFCFYPGGVVILPLKVCNNEWTYSVFVGKDKIVQSGDIVQQLKNAGIKEITWFANVHGKYYAMYKRR
jgi:hypothetical protein